MAPSDQTFIGLGCGCCLISVVLVLILSSYKGLHVTKFALARNSLTGVVNFDNVYHGGRHFLGPWKGYLEFPATVQSIEWISSSHVTSTTQDLSPLQVRASDGLNVKIGVIAKYFINKDKLPDIYRTYKMNLEGFFSSSLRSAILGLAGTYRATQLYEDRVEVSKALLKTCHKVCSEALQGYLTCWRVDLLEVELGTQIEAANIKQQVEKQKQNTEMMNRNASLIRSGTEVIESDFDRQIQVVHATANSKAYSLTSEAKVNATRMTQDATAQALSAIQGTLRSHVADMTQEDLLSYLEKVTLIESHQGSMVYGDFSSASVYQRPEL